MKKLKQEIYIYIGKWSRINHRYLIYMYVGGIIYHNENKKLKTTRKLHNKTTYIFVKIQAN